MGKSRRLGRVILSLVAGWGGTGCATKGCFDLSTKTYVTAAPEPPVREARDTTARAVIDSLIPGHYMYSDVRYEKDFMLLRVTTASGRVGWIVADSAVTLCEKVSR